jgi:peptidoglycan hydrolase-like protein with peptidoglycan-binding domain
MKWVPLPSLLAACALCLSASSQTSSTSAKKPATKPVTTKPASAKGGAHTLSASASKTHKAARGRARSKRTPAPTYQLHPDPERYQQIQQALADRGYFKGQVNGEWGDDSVDAMKRFQTDQKLEPDGKVNSLSLIGLGLGAKHDAAAAAPAGLSHPAADSTQPAPAEPSQLRPPTETAPPPK